MDDEERRITEGKLLKYIYNILRVAPPNEKPPMHRDAAEMANGMVVVRSPEALAWKLDIDWQDPIDLKDLDYETIHFYATNFNEPSARMLHAFLHSEISPFEAALTPQLQQKPAASNSDENSNGEDDEDQVNQGDDWSPVTVLEMISDSFDNEPEFLLNYRILGQLYLRSQEYESAADVAKKGLQMLKKMSKETLNTFANAETHLLVVLGTAYTYYQAPKNFDKAIQMFDLVLKSGPNVHALIGKGLILIEKGNLDEAEKLLKQVYDSHPDNFQALFELSWCRILKGQPDGLEGLTKCLEMVTGSDPESLDYRAKIHWRIGHHHWKQGRHTDAFNSYVKSLQQNPNYAPAYTSLGEFYADAVGDKVRATKCFYRAFEIDGGEIDAAYRLATEFADNSEWGLVEVVANRTIESERLRTFSNREASWPYRALGIVGLNKRDYAQAVQYFQSSLRISPKDANSWIGLGEAYTNSGRFVAAAKAFDRALLLDPGNWIAQYQLGIVKQEVMQYQEAIDAFQHVLEIRPGEMSVRVAIVEAHLRFARYNLSNEFFSQAVDQAVQCVESAARAVDDNMDTQDVWKAVGDACEVFLLVESQEHKVPESLMEMLATGCDRHEVKFRHDDGGEDDVDPNRTRKDLKRWAILAFELSLACCRPDMSSRAMTHYNLGLAELKWGTNAIEHLKKAIQLEHRNTDFWNAYGIASSTINPRVAQHCFIRSLSFDMAQPAVWANLGALYLVHGDLELAEEAFDKTQALDPEFVQSWIGQGIIENTKGHSTEANALFDQSFLLSKGSDGLAKLLYGMSVLERAHQGQPLVKGYNQEVETSVLALQKFLMLAPKSDLGLTIQGMLLEREKGFEYAIEHIEKHCQYLEQKYEKEEDSADLVKFAKAKAHLARLYLAAGHFEQAVEHAEFAIDVMAENEGETPSGTVSATLTAGLAYYFSGSFDSSIEYFKQALEQTQEDQDVVVLLAQVLWAHGGENEKDVALDQLYASVGEKGALLKITLLLGAIGIVDDVADLRDAAREELNDLDLKTLKSDRENQVQEILALITKSHDPWRKAAFLWPSNYKVWKKLDQRVALKLASNNNDGQVSSVELSDSIIDADPTRLESCQRAVFYAPWNVNAWSSLSYVHV